MTDSWFATAPGPYLTIERSNGRVLIFAEGEDQHLVVCEGAVIGRRVVDGHDAAHELAHRLAERLGA